MFEELIEHVLKEANNMNMKSIAIPGPNGAVFSMPMMKTCDIILTVTNAFLMKQNDQSCLKKIVVIHSSQHVVRSLLFLSQSIFCSRTLLTESASSILGDDMAVNNPSQHVKSTEHGYMFFILAIVCESLLLYCVNSSRYIYFSYAFHLCSNILCMNKGVI